MERFGQLGSGVAPVRGDDDLAVRRRMPFLPLKRRKTKRERERESEKEDPEESRNLSGPLTLFLSLGLLDEPLLPLFLLEAALPVLSFSLLFPDDDLDLLLLLWSLLPLPDGFWSMDTIS